MLNQKNTQSYTGWWFQPTPLKNDGVKVSWDDFPIPNIWKHKIPWFQSPPTRIDIFGAEGETWTSFYGRCCVVAESMTAQAKQGQQGSGIQLNA